MGDDFGSEIGKKMRSAVKAKLLELGTGGPTGYIDDELPDYVMIMVANKRSKQQMIADLDLFLGDQTELFVTWLHEVLQKLQEVTLMVPQTVKKRKYSENEDTLVKREKRINKKEKRPVKTTQVEQTDHYSNASEMSSTAAAAATEPDSSDVPVITSITDVFAENLLKKAQHAYDFATEASEHVKKGKGKKTSNDDVGHTSAKYTKNISSRECSHFDIPPMELTYNEVATSSMTASDVSNREKDLAELADIQAKIYEAKKHLKRLEQLPSHMDSGDEDYLNLKEDGNEELMETFEPQNENPTPKNPVVFDKEEVEINELNAQTSPQTFEHKESSISLSPTPPPYKDDQNRSSVSRFHTDHTHQTHDNEKVNTSADSKKSVHERLGMRREEPQRERKIRQDKLLYVPGYRRNEMDKSRESDRNRDRRNDRPKDERRDHEKDRERERERCRDRERERERERERIRAREKEREREREKEKERELERNRERDRDRIRERGRSNRDDKRDNFERISSHDRSRDSSLRINDRDKLARTQSTEVPYDNEDESEENEEEEEDEEFSVKEQNVQRQRIGSRVVVAPAKIQADSSEDDAPSLSVNSVVKIKPRPLVPQSKQACKNLLLKAVAEAQRSTNQAKSRPKESKEPTIVKTISRNTKLYTKSYRDRIKRGVIENSSQNIGGGELFKRSKEQLLIEIGSRNETVRNKSLGARLGIRRNNMANDKDEYVPESVSDQIDSDLDYIYIPQAIKSKGNTNMANTKIEYENSSEEIVEHKMDEKTTSNTQFVVTLNEDKTPSKYKKALERNSRSATPEILPQNNRFKSVDTTNLARPHSRDVRKYPNNTNNKNKIPAVLNETNSSTNSSRSGSSVSVHRRSDLIEIYRKPKDIKKIIIQNDSEDEIYDGHTKKHLKDDTEQNGTDDQKSTTPPLPQPYANSKNSSNVDNRTQTRRARTKSRSHTRSRTRSRSRSNSRTILRSTVKQKHVPIRFDSDKNNKSEKHYENMKRRSSERHRSMNRDLSSERTNDDRRKISIRNTEAKKYENIPSLNSVALDSSSMKVARPKERCKYHPNCTKQFCEFYHPTAPCKVFPNCKYGDKCIYSHPKCKYDMACTSIDCNYSHSGTRNPSQLQTQAPPLSSHVVPVQNYKSISAPTLTVATTMCKYYPNCSKVGCLFFHPKQCHFGKNCINKLECNFYHPELQSSNKFKWVASIV